MSRRSYRQNCALARTADIVGERWTLLILRELLVHPARYSELAEGLPGMGTNLLAARLKDLEHAGLVERAAPDQRRSSYRLTKAGQALEPAVLALIRWGYQFTRAEQDGLLHRDHWDLLAMKALYRPERCRKPLTVQFATPDFMAFARASGTGLETGLGTAPDADIEVDFTPSRVQDALRHKADALDPRLRAFAECFDLNPEPQP